MNSQHARSRWLAGLLLAGALALGIAIYFQATSRPAPGPIGHELQDNAANSLDPSPNVEPTASAPLNPAAFLLSHRRQRGSAAQAISNAQINANEPARAGAEEPSVPAPPGSASQLGRSSAVNLGTDIGPAGVPISAENLGRNGEAARNNDPPVAPTLKH